MTNVTAQEGRGAVAFNEIAILRLVSQVQVLRRRAGTSPLLRHGLVEGRPIDLQALFSHELTRQFDWETVRVVQFEGDVARENACASLGDLVTGLFKQRHTRAQGAGEARLLALEDRHDELTVLHQHGVGASHLFDSGVNEGFGNGRIRSTPARRQNGATNNAAQHVTTAFVRRQHAVSHKHRHGPTVLGNATDSNVRLLVRPVGNANGTRRRLEQRRKEVGRKDGLNAVEDRQHAFKAGAGVNVLLGQIRQRTAGALFELHEHEVPELNEPVIATESGAAVGAEGWSLVEEDLRAGAARPRVAHVPEVVLAEALDALRANANQVTPELFGLVVAVVHRNPEPLGVEAKSLCNQAPCVLDGAFLEVVAKGEVAHHLEEREVALGGADDVDVGGSEALLDRHSARRWRRFFEQEVRLEGDHAGHRKQERGVVGNQRGRRGHQVPVVSEVVEKNRSKLRGFHALHSTRASFSSGGDVRRRHSSTRRASPPSSTGS